MNFGEIRSACEMCLSDSFYIDLLMRNYLFHHEFVEESDTYLEYIQEKCGNISIGKDRRRFLLGEIIETCIETYDQVPKTNIREDYATLIFSVSGLAWCLLKWSYGTARYGGITLQASFGQNPDLYRLRKGLFVAYNTTIERNCLELTHHVDYTKHIQPGFEKTLESSS